MLTRSELIQMAAKELEERGFNITIPDHKTIIGESILGSPLANIDYYNEDHVDLIATKDDKTYRMAVRPAWNSDARPKMFRFSTVFKPYPDVIFLWAKSLNAWIDLPGDFCKNSRSHNSYIPSQYINIYL